MYSPLKLNPILLEKQTLNRWKIAVKTFLKFLPIGVGDPKWRSEYNEIKFQLEQRPTFPIEAWSGYLYPIADVRKLSKLSQEYSGWPNYHFIPEDPLKYILLMPDPCEAIEFLMDLEEQFNVKYQEQETQIAYQNWTFGQFVKDVLNKKKTTEE